jgi:hypothetical protein
MVSIPRNPVSIRYLQSVTGGYLTPPSWGGSGRALVGVLFMEGEDVLSCLRGIRFYRTLLFVQSICYPARQFVVCLAASRVLALLGIS